jgi:hypothetical protein
MMGWRMENRLFRSPSPRLTLAIIILLHCQVGARHDCRPVHFQVYSMSSLIPFGLMVLALLSTVPARSAAQEKTPQEIENLAKALVPKLGDAKYKEREAASQELLNLGPDALKVVDEGRKNPDPEIAARCESLYPRFRLLDLDRRMVVFAADSEGRIENTFPLGATYEQICGKDENARKFFIEICENNLELLDDAANAPQRMGEAYFDLSNVIQYLRNPSASVPAGAPVDSTLSVTEIAAMFLIGADEKIGPLIDEANRKQPNRDNFQPLVRLFWQPKFQSAVIDVNSGRYLRKLLFAWAKRRNGAGTIYNVLTTLERLVETEGAKLQNDPDTLGFVVDVAVSPSENNGVNNGLAMTLMAGIINKDQIPFIEEKFFKDERTLTEVEIEVDGQKKNVEIRVCDYALWICLKLRGQSFQDYGFDILDPRRELNAYSFAGFTKDETRRAAFKKFEEWRKANPIQKD